jgi:hypothetical protein
MQRRLWRRYAWSWRNENSINRQVAKDAKNFYNFGFLGALGVLAVRRL